MPQARRALPLVGVALGTAVACALAAGAWSSALAEDAPPARVAADVSYASDLSPVEREAAAAALAATVRLATAPEDFRPPDDAAEAAGFVAAPDGLVVTSARYVERVRRAPPRVAVWARAADGPWERVVPAGRNALVDLGLLRFVQPRTRTAMPLGVAPRSTGARLVAAILGSGAHVDLRAAPITTIEWFDPAAASLRVESRRTGATFTPSRLGYATGLRTPETLAGRAVEGTPLVDAAGRCAALVVRVDTERVDADSVYARPADLLAPWVESIARAGRFDPPDLGVGFEPVPTRGPAPSLPLDLATLRGAGKEHGGAVVTTVAIPGPAVNVLWSGDLVLEVAGRAIAGEVAETRADAAAAMKDGVPAEVVVWRGGKRERVSITPKRASEIYKDVDGEMDARAASLAR